MPKFREITGQFVGYIPDSIDADIVPDRAPMNGRVTFTPVFTGGVIAFPELSPPEFAHPRTIHAKIVDGFVQVEVNEGEGDDEHIVLQPLSLMVTVDDEASQVWSWRAEFSEILIGASDEYVQIPSWSFRVPDGTGPVDLTELVPLKSTGTVDVTKGPRGAGLENITAVDGQLVFEYTDGQESTVPIPEAVQGPEGPQGPAGADGEQGPQGEKGDPGEIPDLLVGNITDATPTGKNLMLAATEGAARNALGLAAGATAINGSLEELNNGTQTNSRVWSPRDIANYVESQTAPLAVETAKVATATEAPGDRLLTYATARTRPSATVFYGITPAGVRYKKIRVPGGPFPGLLTNHYAAPPTIGQAPTTESITNLQARYGGSIIFNSHGFGGTRMWGPVIKDGVPMQEIQTGPRGSEVLGFKADGTAARYYGAQGDTVASMVADGVREAFSFGCFFVENGVPRDVDNDPVFNAFAPASARQILGVEQDGTVVLITAEGQSGVSGMGGTEASNFCVAQGLHDAIMLDGGGSAQTVVNGRQIHHSADTGGQRLIPAVGEIRAEVSVVDSDWLPFSYASGFSALQENRSLVYRTVGGVVFMNGTVRKADGGFAEGAWNLIGSLPPEFRPDFPNTGFMPAIGPEGELVTTSIARASGAVNLRMPVRPTYADLSGISFPAFRAGRW